MGRTEHYHDPDAPTPNRIVPAAVAIVRDERGRLLLVQRSDNGLWAPPGGTQDAGERLAQTAERETLEETGYQVRVTDLIGIYTDPNHVIAYDDGEVRQQFAVSFRADLVAGDLQTSDETPTVRWVDPADLGTLPMHESIRLRIDHALADRTKPYIG